MGMSTRNKHTRESNKQRGSGTHLGDRKGSLEKVFGMDAEELTKSKRVCGEIPGRGNCNVLSGKAGGGMEPVNWGDF